MLKISVIVPVYNVEKYLKKCIESILHQDFSEFELLLIDDGSTDNSGTICDEYAKINPQIRVIHQKNKGSGGARNTGIREAKGEYLMFVDSDDYIKSGTMKTIYKSALDYNADVVFFGTDFIDENDSIISVLTPTKSEDPLCLTGKNLMLFFKNTYPVNKLYKHTLFTDNDISFPERIWYEDLCVVSEIAMFAKKIVCIPDSVYCYLQRSDSTMHIKNTDRNIDMLTSVSSVLNFYRKQNFFDENKDYLCFLTVMHVMVLCTLRVATDDPHHPLLEEFYSFTKENFDDFKTNPFVKKNLSIRHKIIFFLSKNKFYRALNLLGKIYGHL